MSVPRGQNGMVSPMPTRSDRDDPVADSSCLAVVFNVSIVSESCSHKYVMMMVWSGFLSPVLGPVSSMSFFAVSDLWYWCRLRLPVWLCRFCTVLCLQVPDMGLRWWDRGLRDILLYTCDLGVDDCGLTLSARYYVVFRYGFVCLWESAFPCPNPCVPSGRRVGLSRPRMS